MSNSTPDHLDREQLRRQFLEQAAAAFDRMFPAEGAPVPPDQREQRARELGQQLTTFLLQRHGESDAGFLRDIFESPEEAPRLIYADWLDEHGQPARAEFIRLQCRMARLEPGDPEIDLLGLREEELVEDHGAAWSAHVPAWARKGVRFERGFVNGPLLPARRFARQGAELRRQVPFDHLRLTDLQRQAQPLLASGLLAGVRHLELRGSRPAEPEDVAALLGSSQLAGLVGLTLTHFPATDEIFRALTSNRHLSRLERLAVWNAELGPAHAAILARSPLLGQLRELDLGDNYSLGPEGALHLIRAPHGGRLRRLSFRNCGLDAGAVRELARSPLARGLTSLSVMGASLSGAADALAGATSLGNLTYLDASICQLGDAGLEALANASGLSSLRSLDLISNVFSADGVRALARGPLLGRLERLRFHDSLGEGAARALAESEGSRHLRRLDLGWGRVGPEGAAALAASPHLERLAWLSLDSNNIGTAGAQALAAGAARLPSLRYLSLCYNEVRGEGARAIVESPLGDQLLRLDLRSNGVSTAQRPPMQARLGRRVRF